LGACLGAAKTNEWPLQREEKEDDRKQRSTLQTPSNKAGFGVPEDLIGSPPFYFNHKLRILRTGQ